MGASGDLAPIAQIALALTGEGEVLVEGEGQPAAEALRAAGLEPIELLETEGLALINGTQATTGIGILAQLRGEWAVKTAEVAGATALERLMGTPAAFRAVVQEVRPHPG